MSHKIKAYERRRQILSILAKHGPLSLRAIKLILAPAIELRRLQDSVHRMCQAGLLSVRHQHLFGGSGKFYQINQHDFARNDVAKILGCHPEALVQTQFRYRELLHNDQCAVWANKIKILFPDSKILREFEFRHNPTALKAISDMSQDHELRPDLLIIFNEHDSKKYMVIGVEIERVMKSKERLEKKLFKLVARTFLDGVIYICDSDQMIDTLNAIYSSKVIHKAIRVKNYGENFLLLTDGAQYSKAGELKMYNAKLQNVCLSNWLHTLSTSNVRSRNDHMFSGSALAR